MSKSAPILYWESQGPADGETVVLSAGLGGSGHYWESQLPALRERYRVLVYDHFGTGRSGGEIPEYYTVADMADELEAMLVTADAGRVHLVGHALGGLIGIELARGRGAGWQSVPDQCLGVTQCPYPSVFLGEADPA